MISNILKEIRGYDTNTSDDFSVPQLVGLLAVNLIAYQVRHTQHFVRSCFR